MPRPKSGAAQTGAIFGRRGDYDGSSSDRAAAARPVRLEVWSESAGGYVLLAGYYDEQAAIIAAEQRRGLVRVRNRERVVAQFRNGRRSV